MELSEETLNPIKESFSIEVFKAKMWLPPHEYYLYIAKRAIECGLLTNSEFKQLTGKFRHLRLSPASTCRAFDIIVKTRWEERDTNNYFSQVNRDANESGSLSSKLLAEAAKRKMLKNKK